MLDRAERRLRKRRNHRRSPSRAMPRTTPTAMPAVAPVESPPPLEESALSWLEEDESVGVVEPEVVPGSVGRFVFVAVREPDGVAEVTKEDPMDEETEDELSMVGVADEDADMEAEVVTEVAVPPELPSKERTN